MSSRIGLLFIVSAGALAGACGGASGAKSTDTAPQTEAASAAQPPTGSSGLQPTATAAAASGSGTKAASGASAPAATTGTAATSGASGKAAAGVSGGSSSGAGTAGELAAAGSTASAAAGGAATVHGCEPRMLNPSTGIHFHHVHFNTVDPDKDLDFYEKYFGSTVTPFCMDKAGKPLAKANKTERAWFLFSRVATQPDMKLNTYMEHVGWIHQDPASELMRLVALGAPRYPAGGAQCESAFDGTAPCASYWFYLLAPNGARVEVALGPGPSTSGYGHVHLVMGEDFSFIEKFTNSAFNVQSQSIDGVNHTDALLAESMLSGMAVETRGKPIDHLGYSTANLEAERDRVVKAGITIAEDISYKPEFGFRSFFVKTAKGLWLEMVEDSQFEQTAK